MTRDGRNEGGISLVDEVIHMICSPHGILYLFHSSFHLVHLFFQMWYLRVTVPLDWSPLALFLAHSFSKFWPRSSPRCC